MPNIVILNHQKINQAMLWALNHFQDQFDFELLFPQSLYVFKFQNPEDATLFALKWS